MRANANKRRQTLTNASKHRGENASKRKQTRAKVDKRKQTLTPHFIAVLCHPLRSPLICNPLRSAPNHKSQIASDLKSRSPNHKTFPRIAVSNGSSDQIALSNRSICLKSLLICDSRFESQIAIAIKSRDLEHEDRRRHDKMTYQPHGNDYK